MLTRILHNSPSLCTFLDQLGLDFSQPQRQHILNMADALLVCEDVKTLSALQRQFVEAPDVSNMADFLRISPWHAQDVRVAVRRGQMEWLFNAAEQRNLPKILFINLDDSLGQKHKDTRHLEPVDWHYDHTESSQRQPRFKNGICYLACTAAVGPLVVTVDLRLYLRAKTVRRINRKRVNVSHVSFRSKNSLAWRILAELRSLIPPGWQVYVQFDSWYASERLIKYVHGQGWHTICGLKQNRILNEVRLDQLAHALRHRRYTQVRVTAADNENTTYYVRETTGRLVDIPFAVRVFFSKRHPREKSPAYFMCTDLTRSAQWALQGYRRRWSCEVDNFYLKTQLGLTDFRVRAYEAVDKYMVVVLLTWAYVERRFHQERSAQIQTYGDLIRRHQDEHTVDWLTGALVMVQQTGDIQQVIQRFMRSDLHLA